jgi:hypothetical protein
VDLGERRVKCKGAVGSSGDARLVEDGEEESGDGESGEGEGGV